MSNSSNHIQIFEHQKLLIDNNVFTKTHWEALVLFNEAHGNKYCSLGHNYIKWGSYVGVIQIQNLVIEVLPKVDSFEQKSALWQSLLIEMLFACKKIAVNVVGAAHQQIGPSSRPSLLHIYFDLFAQELEILLGKGLVRSYERATSNSTRWKGQWQIGKHLNKNIAHKERIYTIQDSYMLEHSIHEVLGQAVLLAIKQAPSSKLQQQFRQIHRYLPPSNNSKIDWNRVQKLQAMKKFRNYREVLTIAKLLLQNYTPNLKAGGYSTLGILFDMNRLFEEYVYRTLNKNSKEIKVSWQPQKKFWSTKMLRPDILLEKEDKRWVIDVKWKIPLQGMPSDNDLRQIYTYARAFEAESGILVYPKVGASKNKAHYFLSDSENEESKGRLLFLNLFEKTENKLNHRLGQEILALLNIL
ncbi:MAG: hypothetical protein GY810_03535 [Aureispira sp.]|nr:hypothetical protein [Aureispira sp.]